MTAKVLYIEDSHLNLRLVQKMLQIMDYDMVAAENGQTGINAMQHEQPDIILLDINLPDINGYDVLKRIRQMNCGDQVPIIALTADTTNKQRCLEAGFDGYLNKPVSKGTLLRTVKQVLQASSPDCFH